MKLIKRYKNPASNGTGFRYIYMGKAYIWTRGRKFHYLPLKPDYVQDAISTGKWYLL